MERVLVAFLQSEDASTAVEHLLSLLLQTEFIMLPLAITTSLDRVLLQTEFIMLVMEGF